MDATMSQSGRFWDRHADRYARKPVGDEAAYQKKLQVTREYFRPDMEVLEFGCGTGTTALLHAPYVKHIRAIDVSTRMIEIAKGKAEAGNVENVTFERGTIEDFNAPDETYDAVMGHSILHLLADRDAVIAKVHKMLKPGGIFVSSTVCLGNRLKVFKYVAPIGRFIGLMPLVKIFTTQELLDSLTAAGFEIDHQWEQGKRIAVFVVAKKPQS